MKQINNCDGIIFDMDGTIWDTREAVMLSWNESFAKSGIDKICTVPELEKLFGKTMENICLALFPDRDFNEIWPAFKKAMDHENEYIAANGGILYPGVKETLEILSGRFPLYIVSNCQTGYIEAFYEYYGTKGFFKKHLCYGDNNLPKADNIKLIVESDNLKSPVYIGDTALDKESSIEAGTAFIWASYGFGSAVESDYSIEAFADIPSILA